MYQHPFHPSIMVITFNQKNHSHYLKTNCMPSLHLFIWKMPISQTCLEMTNLNLLYWGSRDLFLFISPLAGSHLLVAWADKPLQLRAARVQAADGGTARGPVQEQGGAAEWVWHSGYTRRPCGERDGLPRNTEWSATLCGRGWQAGGAAGDGCQGEE